jgi:hypothetical protein
MLKNISKNIWIIDGDAVPFFGMPYTTRTTIIRLSNGDLWIHSPLKISINLIEQITELGNVKYLIAPNKLHHLFLADWMQKFPDAICYAPPGLSKKRPDITFSKDLGMQPEKEWKEEIDQTIFKGSPAMEEVVFFHRGSNTLILTDLIENFKPESFNWWQRILAKFTGILSPHGKTPIDWRLTFVFGKKKAKQSLSILMAWKPENIIVSHGECIFGNGLGFMRKSFSWIK